MCTAIFFKQSCLCCLLTTEEKMSFPVPNSLFLLSSPNKNILEFASACTVINTSSPGLTSVGVTSTVTCKDSISCSGSRLNEPRAYSSKSYKTTRKESSQYRTYKPLCTTVGSSMRFVVNAFIYFTLKQRRNNNDLNSTYNDIGIIK